MLVIGAYLGADLGVYTPSFMMPPPLGARRILAMLVIGAYLGADLGVYTPSFMTPPPLGARRNRRVGRRAVPQVAMGAHGVLGHRHCWSPQFPWTQLTCGTERKRTKT